MGASERGFTLIEVLVALALATLALSALLLLMARQLDGAAHLRDKQMAQWVALNQVTLARLANRHRGEVPQAPRGVERLGGRDWYYQGQLRESGAEGILRLELSVSAQPGGASLVTLDAWLDRWHRLPPP